jgi:hypothetical protein
VLMALHAKMIPSVQVNFSVSSQEVKDEGTAGNFKESGTFIVGGRQWKLRCYPTCMNDHQWMDVPYGILVILVPLHKSKWYVSRCCYEDTHSHMAIWSHYVIVWQTCDCFHVGVSVVVSDDWRLKRCR